MRCRSDPRLSKINAYPSLLHQSAQSAAPDHQQILNAGSLDTLLFSNLATDLGTTPQVQYRYEHRQGVHDAALAQLFGVLTKGVAWTEIGDDT